MKSKKQTSFDYQNFSPSGSAYQFEYSIKDHLGNTRLTFSDLNSNRIVDVPEDILQENHYYPFGLNMNYAWMNNNTLPNTRYQYNGKELNDDFGLNWNDYGARWYDPAVGRFPSVDPIIENFPYLTPYNYASNNPINMIDIWGLQGMIAPPPNPPVEEQKEITNFLSEKFNAVYSFLFGSNDDNQEGNDNNSSGMISPVKDPVITSEQAPSRVNPVDGKTKAHDGIDIVAKDRSKTLGKDVVSPANGKIVAIKSKNDGNRAGNRIHMTDNEGNKY